MYSRRLWGFLAALVMTALLFMPDAYAVSLEDVVVRSAPLIRSTAVKNGMVRVRLKDMGEKTHLDITVTGNYSVNGNTEMTLSTGDEVDVDFDTATGEILLTINGTTYSAGSEMRLRRHQADGESALSIAQAKKPGNYYPGDLQLLAVQGESGFVLYPILHVYLEYYLCGVVPYEMNTAYPIEALKAQAVAARTYALRAMAGPASKNYDLMDTSSHQVYKGYTGNTNNATKAVEETKGIVIMNDGVLSGPYYTASNGGQTESAKNYWGGSDYPYLGVKEDPFDYANSSGLRRTRMIYSDFDHENQIPEFAALLTSAAQAELGADAVIQTINSVTPHTPKYNPPSRLYTLMDFGVTVLTDAGTKDATLTVNIFTALETALSASLNGSSNELWTVAAADEGFQVTVARRGHGIGMSQRGAQKMAQMGYTYDQILGFYYEGCERIQYTFSHTILPVGSSSDITTTEPPASITPADQNHATVQLVGVEDITSLRYTPEADGDILTGVPNGAAVVVLSKDDSWSLVRYGEIAGYLMNKELVFTGTPSSSTTEEATVIEGWATVTGTNALNFREAPSYDNTPLTELAQGTVLCVLENDGEWAKVQWGNRIGYVSTAYLAFHDEYPGEVNSDSSAMVSLASEEDTAALLLSPSMTGTAIAQIPHGTQVTVLSNDGSWCLIEVVGVEGYLLASQLDFEATGVTPTEIPGLTGQPAVVNTTSSSLNLRAGPTTNDEILAEIPKGQTVVVTTYGDTWCEVRWGTYTGYVATQYLLFEEEETPTPSPSPTSTETATPDSSESPSPSPSPSPDISADPEELTAWVMKTVSYVNLRETASTMGTIITRIPSGDEVVVLEKGGTFSLVRHGVGTGYVLSKHLTYTKPLHSIGIMYVNTAVDPLALRDEPDVHDTIVLTRMPRGEKVMLVEKLGDWCYVQYGDYVGYCATEYLSHRKPTEYEVDDTPIYDPSMVAADGWSARINTADGFPMSMHKWCSAESPTLTTIPNGNVVTLLAYGDVWCRIRYEGETGYCLTKKVVLLAPETE